MSLLLGLGAGAAAAGAGAAGSSFLGGLGGLAASSAVSGGVSGLLGNLFAKRNMKNQLKYNKQLMDYQDAINDENALVNAKMTRDLWKYQQEYNSPENIRARLEQAGINPMAAFGSTNVQTSGGLAAPAMSNVSGGSVAGAAPSIPADPEALSRIELNKANAEYMREKSQTEETIRQLNEAAATLDSIKGIGENLRNEGQRIANDIANATKDVTIGSALQNLNSLSLYVEKLGQEIKTERFKTQHTEADIARIEAATHDLQASASLKLIDAVLRQHQIHLTDAQKESALAMAFATRESGEYQSAYNETGGATTDIALKQSEIFGNYVKAATSITDQVWQIVKVFVPAAKVEEVTSQVKKIFNKKGEMTGRVNTTTTKTKAEVKNDK